MPDRIPDPDIMYSDRIGVDVPEPTEEEAGDETLRFEFELGRDMLGWRMRTFSVIDSGFSEHARMFSICCDLSKIVLAHVRGEND